MTIDPNMPADLEPEGERPRRRSRVAEALVELVRAAQRIVRDEETGAFYAVAENGARPLELEEAVSAAMRELYEQTGRVAGRDATTQARRLLADPKAPRARIVSPAEPELSPAERELLAAELLDECRELAEAEELLEHLRRGLSRDGYVGSTAIPELVYLAAGGTTILDPATCKQPVSIAIGGSSGSGKNYAAESALAFLPPSLCHLTSGMSGKALVYDRRDLRNAYLYVPEGSAIAADSDAALMLRTLISEGRLAYQVVVTRDNAAPVTELVEREGPTGLIVTSSAVKVDRDLETRMLRLHVADDPELTRAIAVRIGVAFELGGIPEGDRSAWHALYRWHRLTGPHRVRVPFAPQVSHSIPPAAVRLRRDVAVLWTLVAAHAALHRLNREHHRDGVIVAHLRDYAAVRELLEPVLATSAGTALPAWASETWQALPLEAGEQSGITYTTLGEWLDIGRDAAHYRAAWLIEQGAAANLAPKGKPARLVRGDVPVSERLLPLLDELERDGRCAE